MGKDKDKRTSKRDDDGLAERVRNTAALLRRFAEEHFDEEQAKEICSTLPEPDDE